uniref:Uncharacterized protein n=1 Tax=Avena sativa TaxID=4498 RepID=A0ACD5X4F4_AVESA
MASDLDLSKASSSPNLPPSSSAEGVKQGPAADISWMMLDRFVFRRDDDDGSFPDVAAAPMRASSSTSLGDLFTVALLVAAPPAVSRLYVQWPRDPREPVDLEDKVTNLVTAHRNLLLLCTTSRLMVDKIPYRQDYFVFKAAAPASAGVVNSRIKRIPACPEPLEGRNITEPRLFHNDTIGMVYRSGYSDEFAVVQLAKFVVIPGCPNKMEAELCVFRSSLSSSKSIHEDNDEGVVAEGKWEVLMLPIHHSEEEFSDLRGFSTDGAITFNNSICWVDYHHGGILSYKPAPLAAQGVGESIISYIRLPIDDRPNNSLPKCLEMYRSLSVTGTRDNEQLKFIDVACKARAYVGPSFTITCHTFTPRSDNKWHKKVIITSEKLWYINFRNVSCRRIL